MKRIYIIILIICLIILSSFIPYGLNLNIPSNPIELNEINNSYYEIFFWLSLFLISLIAIIGIIGIYFLSKPS